MARLSSRRITIETVIKTINDHFFGLWTLNSSKWIVRFFDILLRKLGIMVF